MTEEDFQSITHNGQLCDSEGGLGLKEFDHVMRDQVPVGPPQIGNHADGLQPGGRHGKTKDGCTVPMPAHTQFQSLTQSFRCFKLNNRNELPNKSDLSDSSSLRPKERALNQASVCGRLCVCVFVCSSCAFFVLTCFLDMHATAADPPIHPAVPG